MRLLEGLDDIGLTLKHADEIKAWERRMAATSRGCRRAADQPADDPASRSLETAT